jgi:hypothetical protein
MALASATTIKVRPLNIERLRKNLQIIMTEIDRTQGVLPDYYSPTMWQRLQRTAYHVANAIQAVRIKLSNPELSCEHIALKLGLERQQVAGYLAWNTMLDPKWIKPQFAIEFVGCPKCGASPGQRCNYASAPTYKIHDERREAYRQQRDDKHSVEHDGVRQGMAAQ